MQIKLATQTLALTRISISRTSTLEKRRVITGRIESSAVKMHAVIYMYCYIYIAVCKTLSSRETEGLQ